MHSIVHHLIVLAILVAGVLLARLFPAKKETAEVAPSEPSPPAMLNAPSTILNETTYLVRPPIKPVATPDTPTFRSDSAASQTATTSKAGSMREPARQKSSRLPPIKENRRRRPGREKVAEDTRLPSIREMEQRRRTRGRLTSHRIADGDDLRLLAGKYLRDESRYMEIFDMNRRVLARPDLLPVGQELRIYDERK